MRHTVLVITAFATTIATSILVSLGLDYIDPAIGYGLHPGIAFPLATLMACTVVTLAVLITSNEADPYDRLAEQDAAVVALAKDGIYLGNWPKLDQH